MMSMREFGATVGVFIQMQQLDCASSLYQGEEDGEWAGPDADANGAGVSRSDAHEFRIDGHTAGVAPRETRLLPLAAAPPRFAEILEIHLDFAPLPQIGQLLRTCAWRRVPSGNGTNTTAPVDQQEHGQYPDATQWVDRRCQAASPAITATIGSHHSCGPYRAHQVCVLTRSDATIVPASNTTTPRDAPGRASATPADRRRRETPR